MALFAGYKAEAEVPCNYRSELERWRLSMKWDRAPKSGDQDEDLLGRIAAGDVSAMRMMVARQLPRIVAVATRMLGDAAEAEDVAQETFLRIWRNAGGWRQRNARFSTWVHRVAINLCYDRLRRRKDVLAEHPPDIEYEGPAPDADLMSEDDPSRRVERALQMIAPRQREAIILVYYQALSNVEAAEVMDVSVDALESLLARGRRSLQGLLLKDEGDG
ncbi:RNA polymerase sigma-70 factor (ECF subfamily) [Rhizobium miluonense]|uniref:RNA polymerase sigma-70 factor (ECF subfamily) n=2 Tax=Rhizobium/Agrobacterium group TaxID=227290 RepID=A0ABU1SUL6_9HYPH|nr:RNA polymerase sigma-70 factor (ECF subfamily) [Rhizobium miluonense]